jgi:hypothetical protein
LNQALSAAQIDIPACRQAGARNPLCKIYGFCSQRLAGGCCQMLLFSFFTSSTLTGAGIAPALNINSKSLSSSGENCPEITN